MAKMLSCREVDMDCDFAARGDTEEEIMTQAANHACRDHGFEAIPPEVIEKVKAAIRDE